MKDRFFLNVIVVQGPTILELLACEDKPLLIRRNALNFLNLFLHLLDCVRMSDTKLHFLTSQCLDSNIVTTI